MYVAVVAVRRGDSHGGRRFGPAEASAGYFSGYFQGRYIEKFLYFSMLSGVPGLLHGPPNSTTYETRKSGVSKTLALISEAHFTALGFSRR
jgi:hypothetical protein